jgi:hypothetical protein
VTCRVLKVSTSGLRRVAPSARDVADAYLIHTLREVHAGSRRIYACAAAAPRSGSAGS